MFVARNNTAMKRLTRKEEEIMDLFWENGPMFVRELRERYADPKPHFNTLSTIVRILESEGFLGHSVWGNSFQYNPLITKDQYHRGSVANLVDKYFGNSYRAMVSSLVEEEKLSLEDLKEVIDQIEKGK